MNTRISDEAAAAYQRALALHQLGRLDDARTGYQRVLQLQPQNAAALNLLGIIALQTNDPLSAVEWMGKALDLDPRNVMAYVNRGSAYSMLNQHAAAVACYDKAIELDPESNASPFYNRGNALQQLKQYDAAIASYDQAIALESDLDGDAYFGRGTALMALDQPAAAVASFDQAIAIGSNYEAEAYSSRGMALQLQGQYQDAIASHDQAIAIKAGNWEAHNRKGAALHQLRQFAAAVRCYDAAIALKPDYAQAYNNRGLALTSLKHYDAALASYDRALQFAVDDAVLFHKNRGIVLHALRRYEAAIASFDRVIALAANDAEAYHDRGVAQVGLTQFDAAIASFDKAIALKPEYAKAYNHRGFALTNLKRYEAALASYDRATAIDAGLADAHFNRGNLLAQLKRPVEAQASYERAMALEPHLAFLSGQVIGTRMAICDWSQSPPDLAHLSKRIEQDEAACSPFGFLALSGSAALQQRAAQIWVRDRSPLNLLLPAIPKRARHDRIRIGYFSADYHDHATSYLIAGLFEMHDRSRFQVIAFSFGPDSPGAMRARIKAACDEFIDVRDKSDPEVAQLAREREIDIAIDLKGFTDGNRVGIFALRAAPLQVGYLGYPGTLGASYMDYLIADHTLVPEESRHHYAEKVVYLPDSYQANDAKRAIADRVFTRAELGLPAAGFVFCCFNNNYKIMPDTFDRWMRILERVPGSVLWLLADNPTAVANLRREAARRNVSPERLVFAERIDLAEHLARHRVAGLFIDTWPYNAHTTASDALWAGLPVLTCAGEGFASRVAASLLKAVGLPELIVSTPEHYEELAVQLATDAQRLSEIKQRLAGNRLTAPLFDTQGYTRHIETAYTTLYERYRTGLPVEHIDIERLPADVS
jgi:predicted O-linked N-acetylglucosamine transferase (SPINDLY family)